MPWVKRVVSLIVLLAVFSAASKAIRQLGQQQLDWTDLSLQWMVAAVACYFASMCSGWCFWHVVLLRMGQKPSWTSSFCAFFYGQLAKYIPGKALVVVVRTATVAGPGTRASVAAISVFVETVTWLAIAATIAFVMFGLDSEADWNWRLASTVIFICSFFPTLPPVFRKLVGIVGGKKFSEARTDARRGINLGTSLIGWAIMSCGWLLAASSLCLILKALPGTDPVAADWISCLGVVTLASVVGFASFLPGGVGVRELVMIPLLAPQFGATQALAAAILMRVVWVLTELLVAAAIFVFKRVKVADKLPRAD